MSCRRLRVLSKCGPEAATFTQTFTELVSESLPHVLDVVYYPDGITPIYLNNCNRHKDSNIYILYVMSIIIVSRYVLGILAPRVPGRGSQDVGPRTWVPGRGSQTIGPRTLVPGRGSQDVFYLCRF